MKTRLVITAVLVGMAILIGATSSSADTLFLRDGRRIQGELVSVQRGIVAFREFNRSGGGRVIEVRIDEVRRIEFDEVNGYDSRGERGEQGGRPSGLREKDVWVAADKPWADSGIDVRPGQVVYFTTHGGDIQWRRGTNTRANGDPDGPRGGNRPMPSRPIGALIAKIGNNSTDYFFIGENEGAIRMRDGGRLILGINDDNLADNRGAFRVTVFY